VQHDFSGTLVYLVVVAWLYVAVMMAVAEATHPRGTVLGAVFTFLLYGAGPVALVIYLMSRPARRAARQAREAAEAAASAEPDGGGETAADAVAPVRKEP
jgi:Na+-transporting methylmalonyl-CoA/oxaloacetate decarboxylase gamma subunit